MFQQRYGKRRVTGNLLFAIYCLFFAYKMPVKKEFAERATLFSRILCSQKTAQYAAPIRGKAPKTITYFNVK